VRRIPFFAVLMALALSCSEEPDVLVPQSAGDVLLSETNRLTPVMRSSIEGIYRVVNGGDVFGEQVVLKWSYVVAENRRDTTFTLSAFTGREMSYLALEGGTLDSVFIFNGYWRKTSSTETGLARFIITSAQGGDLLFKRNPVVKKDSIVFSGEYGFGDGIPDKAVSFIYDRPVNTTRKFDILAHRGGGRTSDLLPVSENTVEMILFAPRLGANAIEIDVRVSKDGVPFLYHDDEINSRLTQPSGLVGTVEEYTFAQLQAFVRLIHGERIPTLKAVLDAALYRTAIRAVYLDSKPTAPLAAIRELQKEYDAKALAAGREFRIYIGIPSEEKMNEFLALPDYASALSLCELSIDDYHKIGAKAWGPRWTLGTQVSEVSQIHAAGGVVYTWTMDVPSYVEEYLKAGDFDGMVTNYPSMVAYYHYTR
jgi:glycerophosphoryl diester phosphodiesterase